MMKYNFPKPGTAYYRLKFIEEAETSVPRKRAGRFMCSCGAETVALMANVIRGTTKSCGCLAREITSKRSITHGMTGSHDYTVWQAMKQRCLYKKHKSYGAYGGAGITICERWINSFESFLADMGEAPTKLHTIDRMDGLLGYTPENCRWATSKEQGRNKRTNRIVEINGEKRCMSEWADIAGIDRSLFRYRLEHGWTGEKLLLKPTK